MARKDSASAQSERPCFGPAEATPTGREAYKGGTRKRSNEFHRFYQPQIDITSNAGVNWTDVLGGVKTAGYRNFLYAGNPRPNVLTNDWRAPISGSFDPNKSSYFNPSAFARRTNPALDPFGNAARLNGNVRVFPLYTENIAVMRAFRLRETVRLNFRWEAYDLFNLKRWGQPGLDLNMPQTFGLVTSASGNRTMQWALKLTF